jgi:hypothetical protein
MVPLEFPTNVDALTPTWIRLALSVRHPRLQIRAIKPQRVIWGTATKAFYELDYEGTPADCALPRFICVKGSFDERLRAYYDLGIIFVTEAAFYRDVAPQLGILLPKVLFADENGKEGVVVLEDLAARSVSFGDPTQAWTPEQVVRVLDVLAQMHATTWGWVAGDPLRWLTLGSRAQREGLRAMMSGDRFRELTARPQVRPYLSRTCSDHDRILQGFRRLWELDDQDPDLALGHGDAHLGQTFIQTDGSVGLLDWQSVAIMPWSKDVSYFIGSALTVEDRRTHERELLELYLRSLEARGGPSLDRHSAWQAYRMQMLHGMVWPVVTEQMQSVGVISALCERFLTAIADLDPLGVLGV